MPEPEFTELKGSTIAPLGDMNASLIEVAQEAVAPVVLDPENVYAVRGPAGETCVADLEHLRPAPERIRGVAHPATVEGFIAYVNRFATDKTTVWVHPTDGKIVAMLDDDGPDSPSWATHRAELVLLATPEWEFWLSRNGDLMPQQEFAEHIEDGLGQVEDPAGAKMLEIAQSISTTNNVAFATGYDLTSGEVRFTYEEQLAAKAGQKGDLVIPQEFTLGLAPFVGEDAFKIMARFRYRVKGSNLLLGYKIEEPDAAIRAVVDGIAERVGAEFTNTYLGSAPSKPPTRR